MEPILSEESNRYVLLPIMWPDVWAAYKNHMKAFWTAEEIDFPADISDWGKLNPAEKNLFLTFYPFSQDQMGLFLKTCLLILSTKLKFQKLELFMGFKLLWKLFIPRLMH